MLAWSFRTSNWGNQARILGAAKQAIRKELEHLKETLVILHIFYYFVQNTLK